ncbi:class I SAM-dependent methyltransferase [Petrachloros mirabilis]
MAQATTHSIIEAQQKDWNRVAEGWEKWDHFFEVQMACLNHRIVADARIRQGMKVLDLGSGTGYPAILAAQTVGASGSIVGMDLAEQMLDVAKRKARSLGLSGIVFRAGDVTTLPFEAQSFDAVTSRFCLMFLPDIPKAAAEIARVLKPGGWVAAAVWAPPEKNPPLGLSMAAIRRVVDLPPPDPTAPGIFRLATAGDLAGLFEQAGLVDSMDQEFLSEWSYESEEEYYRSVVELAAPIQNLMAQLSSGQLRQVKQLIFEGFVSFRREHRIILPITVRMVAARKPL